MIVLTGGAGFIGSVTLWRLNEAGITDVVVVDNLASSQKWRNLVKRSYADYLPREDFLELVRRDALPWPVEAIVHLGACSSTTETNADFLMANNFHYSRELCLYALAKGARFINASSAATYGGGEFGFGDDPQTAARLRPLNMYGYSKQLFDLWMLRERLENRIVSLKFFNVYGPNEYHKGSMRSVAVKLFHEIGETGRAELFESSVPGLANGEQRRDFVYVKDCAELIYWLLRDGRHVGGIRNVGTGEARTFNALARCMFSAMGRPCRIEYIPMPPALAKNYQSYTCAEMGWLAQMGCPVKFTSLERGIEDYARNYLAKNDGYL